jgi:KTSC domain
MTEWFSVSSSNVEKVGYDVWEATLTVDFNSGSRYEHDDVPVDEAEGLINAESVGKYYHRHIKGKYRYRRVR